MNPHFFFFASLLLSWRLAQRIAWEWPLARAVWSSWALDSIRNSSLVSMNLIYDNISSSQILIFCIYVHLKKLKDNGKAVEKNDYSCKSVIRLDTWCRSRPPTALSVASVSSPPASLSFPRAAPSQAGLLHARTPIIDEAPHTSVTDEARRPGKIATR